VRAWLDTAWGGERHARRVGKIAEIERTYLRSEAGARR
jgi:ribose 5-phosphate isomerase RpiB